MGFKVPQAAVIHEDYWSKNMDQVIQRLRSAFLLHGSSRILTGALLTAKVVDKMSQLQEAVSETLKLQPMVLVEQYLVGQETPV